MATSDSEGWTRLQLLAEPTRRAVYDAVRAAREPLTRDQVSAAVGISRQLAAFHLDLLADAHLLGVDYARPPGRGGPGAGRPPKRYRVTDVDLEVSVPPRRYDVAARVLARAVAEEDPRPAAERAVEVAREEGEAIGGLRRPGGRLSARRGLETARDVLADLGYEPEQDDGCVRLRNCPFHAVVDVAPALVCGVNEALINGILDGLGAGGVSAELQPAPPDCCVTLSTGTGAGRRARSR